MPIWEPQEGTTACYLDFSVKQILISQHNVVYTLALIDHVTPVECLDVPKMFLLVLHLGFNLQEPKALGAILTFLSEFNRAHASAYFCKKDVFVKNRYPRLQQSPIKGKIFVLHVDSTPSVHLSDGINLNLGYHDHIFWNYACFGIHNLCDKAFWMMLAVILTFDQVRISFVTCGKGGGVFTSFATIGNVWWRDWNCTHRDRIWSLLLIELPIVMTIEYVSSHFVSYVLVDIYAVCTFLAIYSKSASYLRHNL